MTFMLCLLLGPGLLAAQESSGVYEDTPVGEVTEIEAGSRTLYKFQNKAGETVIVDRPPIGYEYDVVDDRPYEGAPAESQQAAQRRVDSALVVPQLGEAVLWILPLVLLGLPAAGLWWWRKNAPGRRSVDRIMLRAGYDVLENFEVPRGEGRQPVPVDYIARTPAGLLLVMTCDQAGHIEGGAGDPRLVVGDGSGERFEIDNPLPRLDARVEALNELTGDVPVYGQVVFPAATTFAGKTKTATTQRDFRSLLENYTAQVIAVEQLDAVWRIFMRHAGRDALSRGNARRREQLFSTAT